MNELIIVGEGTEYPLNGKLTLPVNAKQPVPAVVFVHGSGSSNMDENIYKLTPFKDLAEGLARHGIASIRYDKRSFTYGMKMVRDKKTVITVKEETIEDAVLATEILRNDSRIDSEKIFIIGHSMGGMLAPRIDAEGGNYRGLILMAGSPRKLEEILMEQLDEQMSSMKGIVKWIANKQMSKFIEPLKNLYNLSDEEAKAKKFGNGTTLYYFKEMGENAAPKYLKNLEKPILVMQGAKDFQVKVDKDYKMYQELLADKANATFKLYDNLNHCFVPAIYTDISKAKQEYKPERHIGEEVIGDIAEWIKGK